MFPAYLHTAVCAISITLASAHTCLAQIPGDLDRTFAAPNGYIAGIYAGDVFGARISAIAPQADGKVVLAGTCGLTHTDFCAMRLMELGGLDPTFDGPTASAPGDGKFLIALGTGNSSASAVMIQRDGKIVLAGQCEENGKREYCVARLNPDGSFDETFDGPNLATPGNGKFVLPGVGLGIDHRLTAAVLQPDEKIVLVGYCWNDQQANSISRACLARLNSDGSFDENFDGPAQTAPGNGAFSLQMVKRQGNDYPASLALDTDGNLIVGGHCIDGTSVFVCVVRLTADGRFDSTFIDGSGNFPGKTEFGMGGSASRATSLSVQTDRKIVVTGTCVVGLLNQICAARIRQDGLRDATFGGPAGTLVVALPAISANATGVSMSHDGTVVIVGDCFTGTQYRFCMVRLRSDGTLDSTFDGWNAQGNGFISMFPFAVNDQARAVSILRDGRIVVGGDCTDGNFYFACVARFNGGPFGARKCSMDIDGDGQVLPMTDLTMLMRATQGLTGAGVTGGISFTSNAKRTTWASIQAYLVSQCEMVVTP